MGRMGSSPNSGAILSTCIVRDKQAHDFQYSQIAPIVAWPQPCEKKKISTPMSLVAANGCPGCLMLVCTSPTAKRRRFITSIRHGIKLKTQMMGYNTIITILYDLIFGSLLTVKSSVDMAMLRSPLESWTLSTFIMSGYSYIADPPARRSV